MTTSWEQPRTYSIPPWLVQKQRGEPEPESWHYLGDQDRALPYIRVHCKCDDLPVALYSKAAPHLYHEAYRETQLDAVRYDKMDGNATLVRRITMFIGVCDCGRGFFAASRNELIYPFSWLERELMIARERRLSYPDPL